jgi:hypothetical protein
MGVAATAGRRGRASGGRPARREVAGGGSESAPDQVAEADNWGQD